MIFSLSPFAPDNLVSRDGFGSPVPRQPAHLHTQGESGAYLRDSSRVPRRRPFFYLHRHTPSGQSRVYLVTHLRTDGVHFRESAGTGPVNLKIVPNECCLGRSPWGQLICACLSPHPLVVIGGYSMISVESIGVVKGDGSLLFTLLFQSNHLVMTRAAIPSNCQLSAVSSIFLRLSTRKRTVGNRNLCCGRLGGNIWGITDG